MAGYAGRERFTSRFELLSEPFDGGVRLTVRGELDVSKARELTAALIAAEDGEAGSIVLDLSGVTFLDSAGVCMLVAGAVRSRRDGDRLSVVPSRAVSRVLALAGITDNMPLVT